MRAASKAQGVADPRSVQALQAPPASRYRRLYPATGSPFAAPGVHVTVICPPRGLSTRCAVTAGASGTAAGVCDPDEPLHALGSGARLCARTCTV